MKKTPSAAALNAGRHPALRSVQAQELPGSN
jgi:hypothetical protein